MNKKNEAKRLCWNCDGNVGFQLENCPYCGVNLTVAAPIKETAFMNPSKNEDVPPPPYAGYTATNQEWQEALQGDQKAATPEPVKDEKKEMFALLLLLPGIVFFLFGIALLLFSTEGVFTLEWNQSFAYFYFIGAAPLLYLGYKALR